MNDSGSFLSPSQTLSKGLLCPELVQLSKVGSTPAHFPIQETPESQVCPEEELVADVDEERHQISVAEDYLWEDGSGGEVRRLGFGQVPLAHTGCPFILFFSKPSVKETFASSP